MNPRYSRPVFFLFGFSVETTCGKRVRTWLTTVFRNKQVGSGRYQDGIHPGIQTHSFFFAEFQSTKHLGAPRPCFVFRQLILSSSYPL